ncbi:MAG TPA: DUF6665 family protein [Xanthobacteraceae bacterium]
MTLRPPQGHARAVPVVALDYEIAQEQASALGRLGRALEAALAALAEHDTAGPATDVHRKQLVQQASEALWRFIVQREACGLRDPRPVIRDYRVPAEVYARIGAHGPR